MLTTCVEKRKNWYFLAYNVVKSLTWKRDNYVSVEPLTWKRDNYVSGSPLRWTAFINQPLDQVESLLYASNESWGMSESLSQLYSPGTLQNKFSARGTNKWIMSDIISRSLKTLNSNFFIPKLNKVKKNVLTRNSLTHSSINLLVQTTLFTWVEIQCNLISNVVFLQETLGLCQSEAPKRPDPNLDVPVLAQSIRQHFSADVATVVLTKA